MALLDEKDLRIYRLTNRSVLIEKFLEHVLISIPKQESLDFLREMSESLKEQSHKTFPRLDAATSDLAASELEDEIDYLQTFIKSLAAKVVMEAR